MVLGIGEGSLEIIPEKTSYLPGEMIRGQVKLALNKPIKAKEIRIMFYGEYTEGSGRQRRTRHIFEQKIRLDGEKEYPQGMRVYDFQITIPIIKRYQAGGEGIIASVINFFGQMNDPVAKARWYLDASLDMSMAFDISQKKQISLVV